MMIKKFLFRGAKSEEHGKYLAKLRLNNLYVTFTQIVLLIFLLFLWEKAADNQWIDEL